MHPPGSDDSNHCFRVNALKTFLCTTINCKNNVGTSNNKNDLPKVTAPFTGCCSPRLNGIGVFEIKFH